MSDQVPIRGSAEVRQALMAYGTVEEAAAALLVGVPVLQGLAYRYHLGALYQRRLRRDAPAHWKHPAFVPMQGKVAGVTIVGRAANSDGNAQWRVKHEGCGHEEILPGIHLRALKKQGKTRGCGVCRKAKAAERRARPGRRGEARP